jgi:hypothetical protein
MLIIQMLQISSRFHRFPSFVTVKQSFEQEDVQGDTE